MSQTCPPAPRRAPESTDLSTLRVLGFRPAPIPLVPETLIHCPLGEKSGLVNAIAHRDYSEEALGIEICVFDDRMEIRNPGSLLSTLSLVDLVALRGIHQSRNA